MQNFLRSLFISIFPLFSLIVLVVSSKIQLDQINYLPDGDLQLSFDLSLIGILISSLAVVVFFLGLFIKKRARTSKNLNGYSVFIFVGFLIVLLSSILDFSGNKLYFLIISLLFIGWMAYLFWYSKFNNRNQQLLKAGQLLPEFQLVDHHKNTIESSTFLGNPSIFLFYRGNWCPLCMAQIKEIASKYKELEERGVNMLFISPQPHKYSENLSKKYNLNFKFLTDHNNKAAIKLGILAKNGLPFGFQLLGYQSDTVMPTVIITDQNAEIVFADLTDNYRIRPEPDLFLKHIDSIATS